MKKLVVWAVNGHLRSPAVPPFDRAHTSYSTLIETIRLSCTIFELWRIICQKSPTSIYLLNLGEPVRISPRSLATEN